MRVGPAGAEDREAVIALDTDILVRYFAEDDAKQFDRASPHWKRW
jgi:hypothetical protein